MKKGMNGLAAGSSMGGHSQKKTLRSVLLNAQNIPVK